MDVEDLFGAFDGAEKVNNVGEANDKPRVAVGKRKAVDEDGSGGSGANKRQDLPANESSHSGGADDRKGNRAVAVEGTTALKEGEESSTVREDGTLVKSVSTKRSRVESELKGLRLSIVIGYALV